MHYDIEHRLSKDGSSTLYSHEFGQYYHNPNGAISESRHVFFEVPGILEILKTSRKPLSIFEMGFGTGLNYLLLLDYYQKLELNIPVTFFSVEALPASESVMESCNYGSLLHQEEYKTHLLHVLGNLEPDWNSFHFSEEIPVTLNLFWGKFNKITPPFHPVDFIFHDPFSPEVNGELWTPDTFTKLAGFCSENAILTTYCAASKARAAMAKAGWKVARAPGALGKREMTVASLDEAKLSSLKRVNEKRLVERLDAGEFDDNNS